MRLLFATLYLSQPKLAAVVEDPNGKQRRVEVTWSATGIESKLPPPAWADSVKGEVEYQRDLEQRPVLPWMR